MLYFIFYTIHFYIFSQTLNIVSYSPRETANSDISNISVVFNQPVVPLTSADELSSICPLRISPNVNGRCRWTATNTFIFELSEKLKKATRYCINIPTDFNSKINGSKLEKDFTWCFETERPKVIYTIPSNGSKLVDINSPIYIIFNMMPNINNIKDYIEILENDKFGSNYIDFSISSVTENDEMYKREYSYFQDYEYEGDYTYYHVKISSVNAIKIIPYGLKPQKNYRLILNSGIKPVEGELLMIEKKIIEFKTIKNFDFISGPLKGCVPGGFTVKFTNPVNYGDFYKSLSILTGEQIPSQSEWRLKVNCSYNYESEYSECYLPDMNYEPERIYSFKIDKGLSDIFGNKLGRDVYFNLDTDWICPKIVMNGGFGIIESYLKPRHPVEAVNAYNVNLTKALIPYENFIPFINSGYNDFSLLKNVVRKNWDISEKRNVSLRTFIDYSDVLSSIKGGIVFSELSKHDLNDYKARAVDVVTATGLTVKSSPKQTLIWVTDLKTTQPKENVEVEIRDVDNNVLWKGITDKYGFATVGGWKDFNIVYDKWTRPNLWFFAYDKKGISVISTSHNHGIEPWRFSVEYDYSNKPVKYVASLFSERGVYRPGEIVYIKGVVKELFDGKWNSPSLRNYFLKIINSRDEEVIKTTVTLNSFDTFFYEFNLKDNYPTGMWRLILSEKDLDYKNYWDENPLLYIVKNFSVEEFKPASFEVGIFTDNKSYSAGSEFKARVNGYYLFGQPMSGCTAEMKIQTIDSEFRIEGYDGYIFNPGWWVDGYKDWGSKIIFNEIKMLDLNGNAEFSLKLLPSDFKRVKKIYVEASVVSPDSQKIFSRLSTFVHPWDFYLGLKPSSNFIVKGEIITIDAIAVNPSGRIVNPKEVYVEIKRREWKSARKSGVGGRLEWISEALDTVVMSSTHTFRNGSLKFDFKPDSSGLYLVTAKTKDFNGRYVESGFSFYVAGDDSAFWQQMDGNLVELVSDKNIYKVGDKAKILIKSPWNGATALITIEREGVIDKWVKRIEGTAGFVEIPIKENYIPNFYVGVVLLKERAKNENYDVTGDELSKPQAKVGYISLKVVPNEKRLLIELSTNKRKYKPSEDVEVQIRVKDVKNKGVRSEVVLWAVDEGVLSLTSYQTPDLLSDFYGLRPLDVITVDSRLYVIGQRSYGEKGENKGGGGGFLSGMDGVDIRKNFVPVAFYIPAIVTDSSGRAKISFKLPDNLTKFRIMAVAVSGDKFGSADTSILVSKPLMLKPYTPRFSRMGDEFDAGVIAFNYTGISSTFTLNMDFIKGPYEVLGEKTKYVYIPDGKSSKILWRLKAIDKGEGNFIWSISSDREKDRLMWKIPVKLNEKKENVFFGGSSYDNVYQEMIIGSSYLMPEIDISVSHTAFNELEQGVKFLLEYPYGCLEQRVSKAIPIIVGADFLKAYGLGGNLEEYKRSVQNFISELYKYQTPLGGFSYWIGPTQLPSLYITLYVLDMIYLAKNTGYLFDEQVVKKALEWVEQTINEHSRLGYPYSDEEMDALKGYSVYILALYGKKNESAFNRLYEKRIGLNIESLLYLLKAASVYNVDKKFKEKLLSQIMNLISFSNQTAYINNVYDALWLHSSKVKLTAMAVDAFISNDYESQIQDKMIKFLINERRINGRWRTTHENAWVLRAFNGYFKKYEKDPPNFNFEIRKILKEEYSSVFSGSFESRRFETKTVKINISDSIGKKLRFEILKKGVGRMYYGMRLSYVPSQIKRISNGFDITREIKPLYNKDEKFLSGSRYLVTIRVKTPQDRTFVVVEDMLPAGFEIVDTSFSTESKIDAQQKTELFSYNWGSFNHSENYDDRILIFADYMSKGEHTYSYIVSATTPGRYYMPAPRVEEMYEPEVFAVGDASEIIVK